MYSAFDIFALKEVFINTHATFLLILVPHSCFLFCFSTFNWNNYRSGTVNSNTVNSKFHFIRSFFEILARFLSFHV